MPNILICDDERSICEMLDITLRREGYKVETANSGEMAKRKLESALYDVVVTDIKMPNINGIEVLKHAHQISPESAVILITAVDDYEAAVEAVKAGGATDYIRKGPGLVDEIKLGIRRALEKVALSDVLESTLFGHLKGAFTSAIASKKGLFEVADGGTIFLDEIGEMTLAMQVKLLRVLQERCLRPVGGTGEIAIDVRVIAATNRDLEKQVSENNFREDLYYRLNVIPIVVPPLRDRREDLPLLVNHFVKKYVPAAGKSISGVNSESLTALATYEWPGNVRQLENTIERAVALATGEELNIEPPVERVRARAAAVGAGGDSLTLTPGAVLPSDMDMENYVAEIERSLLKSALTQSNGVQARAADVLKISYRSFRHLMKKYEL